MAPALFFILILACWETGFRAGLWNPRHFPGPAQVLAAAVAGVKSGALIAAARVSLARLGLAFALALVSGGFIGLLNGSIPLFGRTLGTLALGLQALPSICWLPLAVLWFGVSEEAILFVTLMGALLAVSISVADGVRSIPPVYLRSASMMGVRSLALYRQVIVPASIPAFIMGAKQGWAFAWRSLMAGELIAVSTRSLGLGQTLARARSADDMPLVLAVMLFLIGIGIVADRVVFARLEQAVRLRWGIETAQS